VPHRLAFCITDLDRGGAEWALVQIVTRLNRDEWSPVVYCLGSRGQLADALEQAGIETHCLGAGRWNVGVIWRLAGMFRRQRPAVVQSFLFHANLACRFAARLARVPIVVSGIRVAERDRRWRLWLERWTRKLVVHHVCVSQAVADFAVEEMRLSPDVVSVIPNGVDVDCLSSAQPADLAALGIPSSAATLLFVGRLHPQKGLPFLLEAVRQLVMEDGRDIQLIVVGEGPESSTSKELAEMSGIGDRVHWLGRRDDVPSLMKAATLLVSPSLWEGMPNVVLEAMAAGLPVVATAVEGTTELIRDGEAGWLCRPADSHDLAAKLRFALDAPDERDCRMQAAKRVVTLYYQWASVARSYGVLWLALLESTRSTLRLNRLTKDS
jgi:glycosyltransferase involved in cell wall biosynthesis